MNRYYVSLKRNLVDEHYVRFFIKAYNTEHILDMLGEEYYICKCEITYDKIPPKKNRKGHNFYEYIEKSI